MEPFHPPVEQIYQETVNTNNLIMHFISSLDRDYLHNDESVEVMNIN